MQGGKKWRGEEKDSEIVNVYWDLNEIYILQKKKKGKKCLFGRNYSYGVVNEVCVLLVNVVPTQYLVPHPSPWVLSVTCGDLKYSGS